MSVRKLIFFSGGSFQVYRHQEFFTPQDCFKYLEEIRVRLNTLFLTFDTMTGYERVRLHELEFKKIHILF